jgi:hypothetical protein
VSDSITRRIHRHSGPAITPARATKNPAGEGNFALPDCFPRREPIIPRRPCATWAADWPAESSCADGGTSA